MDEIQNIIAAIESKKNSERSLKQSDLFYLNTQHVSKQYGFIPKQQTEYGPKKFIKP